MPAFPGIGCQRLVTQASRLSAWQGRWNFEGLGLRVWGFGVWGWVYEPKGLGSGLRVRFLGCREGMQLQPAVLSGSRSASRSLVQHNDGIISARPPSASSSLPCPAGKSSSGAPFLARRPCQRAVVVARECVMLSLPRGCLIPRSLAGCLSHVGLRLQVGLESPYRIVDPLFRYKEVRLLDFWHLVLVRFLQCSTHDNQVSVRQLNCFGVLVGILVVKAGGEGSEMSPLGNSAIDTLSLRAS